jgi:tetratricopeptide (TPR) repeat protein
MRYLVLSFIIIVIILATSCSSHEQHKSDEAPGEQDVSSLTAQIENESDNPDLFNQRAIYNLKRGNSNAALADINTALQLDSLNSNYFVTLSSIYKAMGRLNNCIEALDRAEELDPNNNLVLLNRAEVFLILREYPRTFEQVKLLLDRDEFNPEAYFLRGIALLETGDTTLAVRNLMIAVEQDQQHYEAYMQLGLLYAGQLDPLAEGYYRNAINIKPNDPQPYYFLGMYYQEIENIERAVDTYEQIISFDPSFVQAWYNLGYVHLVYMGDFERAVEYFTEAIYLDPKYTEAFYNRGYAYELMGDYRNSRKDYTEAVGITPNYDLAVKGLNRLDRK